MEETPQILPLAGDSRLVVVGKKVELGNGYADLLAVEPGDDSRRLKRGSRLGSYVYATSHSILPTSITQSRVAWLNFLALCPHLLVQRFARPFAYAGSVRLSV